MRLVIWDAIALVGNDYNKPVYSTRKYPWVIDLYSSCSVSTDDNLFTAYKNYWIANPNIRRNPSGQHHTYTQHSDKHSDAINIWLPDRHSDAINVSPPIHQGHPSMWFGYFVRVFYDCHNIQENLVLIIFCHKSNAGSISFEFRIRNHEIFIPVPALYHNDTWRCAVHSTG